MWFLLIKMAICIFKEKSLRFTTISPCFRKVYFMILLVWIFRGCQFVTKLYEGIIEELGK